MSHAFDVDEEQWLFRGPSIHRYFEAKKVALVRQIKQMPKSELPMDAHEEQVFLAKHKVNIPQLGAIKKSRDFSKPEVGWSGSEFDVPWHAYKIEFSKCDPEIFFCNPMTSTNMDWTVTAFAAVRTDHFYLEAAADGGDAVAERCLQGANRNLDSLRHDAEKLQEEFDRDVLQAVRHARSTLPSSKY